MLRIMIFSCLDVMEKSKKKNNKEKREENAKTFSSPFSLDKSEESLGKVHCSTI